MGGAAAFLNRQALKMLDKDGDGKISQQEFHQLYKDADNYFSTRQREAQPADGRTLPNPLPVKEDPLGLRFTQDYFPGTKDPQGRLIAATEANQLVAHRGQLFASFGATYRNPPTPDPEFQGFGVLRKETAHGPWLVDLDLGPRPYRVEVMSSVTFTTDAQGRKLEQPATRLVAARWSPNKTILVRDDASARDGAAAQWGESTVVSGPSLPLGAVFTARSFGSRVDRSLKDFFGQAFHGGGKYTGTIRCAYNPFTAVTDPRTGQAVHLAGVQVYHPGFPKPPFNGSHYLIRKIDGTYDWAPIYDFAHPVPEGRSLDATRRICISPFPEDQDRVLYFAGYDGPYADNRSAWIYRATISERSGGGNRRDGRVH